MARAATTPTRSRDRMSVYEVHLGSWRRHADGRVLSYRELAPRSPTTSPRSGSPTSS